MGKAIVIVAGGFFGMTVIGPIMATTDYGAVWIAEIGGKMNGYKFLGAIVGVLIALLINMLAFPDKTK